MNGRTLAVGAAAVALVAGGLIVSKHHAHAPGVSSTEPQLESTPAATTEETTAPGRDACRFTAGQQFAFEYRSMTKANISPSIASSRTATNEATLSGTLSFEVLAPTKSGSAVLMGRLSGVNAQAKQVAGERVEAPFLAKVNTRCELIEFAHHRDTVRPVARVQHVVATDLAFAIPTGDAQEEGTFHTTIGTQRALIARGAQAGEYVRKPLGYSARWLPSMSAVDVVGGEVSVRRGGSQWFESLRGTEEVRGGAIDHAATQWSAEAKTADAALLANASRQQDDYVWENVLADDAAAPEIKLVGDDNEHQRRVEGMRGVSYETAMTRFNALLERGANINEQWRDMAGFLDAHPDTIDEYVAHITSDEFPPGYKAPAFLALGQTRSPVAREALLGVWRTKEMGPADRMRSSLALVSRTDVGAPLARELRAAATSKPDDDASASVSRQAVLHLGILSGTRPSQREIVDEAQGLVAGLLGEAKTAEDYSVLAGMLGNMADPTMLPRITELSRHPDAEIRSKIPRALRRYRIDLVHPLLVEWLGREDDHAVKRELYNLIYHMHVDEARIVSPEIAKAALKHLQEQPPVLNRQSVIHILEPYVHSDRAVHEAFKEQLKIEMTERSGLYSLVADALPAASVYATLSTVPGMAGQFRNGVEPLLPPVEPRGQEVPIPAMRRAEPGEYPPGTWGGAP